MSTEGVKRAHSTVHTTNKMKPDCEVSSIRDVYIQYRSELCRHVMDKAGVTSIEAEDVVQTTFARVAETGLASVRNHRAFLYKMSYNIAIDMKRRGRVRQKHVEEAVASEAATVEELNPERVVEGSRQLNIIAKALWSMPKKRRQLLMMSRFEGLSYAEIARRVSLSETVVRKHISKALADCQNALQAKCD